MLKNLWFNKNMFNEVVNNSGVRPPYNKVFNWAEALPKNIILKKQIQAENLFKKIGVTFSVYNNYDVSERLIPFDMFPRILTSLEWMKIQKESSKGLWLLMLF